MRELLMVGFNFFFAPFVHLLDKLRAFVELVPFSVTLLATTSRHAELVLLLLS
jgi:hypothetical protein